MVGSKHSREQAEKGGKLVKNAQRKELKVREKKPLEKKKLGREKRGHSQGQE